MPDISDELAHRIANHITDLLVGELPCSLAVPAKDRDLILDRVSQTYRAHLEAHWPEGEDANFTDTPEPEYIPLINR